MTWAQSCQKDGWPRRSLPAQSRIRSAAASPTLRWPCLRRCAPDRTPAESCAPAGAAVVNQLGDAGINGAAQDQQRAILHVLQQRVDAAVDVATVGFRCRSTGVPTTVITASADLMTRGVGRRVQRIAATLRNSSSAPRSMNGILPELTRPTWLNHIHSSTRASLTGRSTIPERHSYQADPPTMVTVEFSCLPTPSGYIFDFWSCRASPSFTPRVNCGLRPNILCFAASCPFAFAIAYSTGFNRSKTIAP